MTVGERLRRYREEKGWSQSDLSRVSQVAQPTISAIEGGSNRAPTGETIHRLAKALEVTMEALMEGNTYEEERPVRTDVIVVSGCPDGSTGGRNP